MTTRHFHFGPGSFRMYFVDEAAEVTRDQAKPAGDTAWARRSRPFDMPGHNPGMSRFRSMAETFVYVAVRSGVPQSHFRREPDGSLTMGGRDVAELMAETAFANGFEPGKDRWLNLEGIVI